MKRIFDILDSEADRAYFVGKKNEGIKRGEVYFQNVGFSYGNNGFCLDNINLKFKPGKVSAIVGSSGSGKTSVINLLYRLWKPDNGNRHY